MTEISGYEPGVDDAAPGDERLDGSGVAQGVRGYLIGLALAAALTAASFYFARSGVIWAPAIPAALTALAVAQMGVHLVFFLHITTGADNTNNVLALAFGVLIVALIIGGSVWIMANMNHNMMPTAQLMRMARS
ncbi:MAG TPA: cytochrome o ubiquinol oxidase subunit IV [Caulobacteraceae bacterium]|nr:cytochrome o ubiquinol oxidase subunit IV [Caulobacteraceae bacterium]